MPITKLTSDDLREPGRELAVLSKLNEALDGINGASGGGTPGPGTFTTLSATGDVTLGDASTDAVGIGITPLATHAAMRFAQALGNKIAVYPIDTTNLFGWGMQADQLQHIVGGSIYHHTFGYGNSGAFTEAHRLSGNGFANIGKLAASEVSLATGTGAKVGFYTTAPVAKQTGVAVTAGAIHAALVALGLIGA